MAAIPSLSPTAALTVVAAAVCLLVAVRAWRERYVPGATPLAVVTAAAAVSALGSLVRPESSTVADYRAATTVLTAGAGLVLAGYLAFGLAAYGVDRGTLRRAAGPLLVEPVAIAVLAATNYGDLFWTTLRPEDAGADPSGVAFALGPAFYAHALYSQVGLLAATGLILAGRSRPESPVFDRTGALLVAVAAPWVGNVAFFAGATDLPTVAWFAVTGVALYAALFGDFPVGDTASATPGPERGD